MVEGSHIGPNICRLHPPARADGRTAVPAAAAALAAFDVATRSLPFSGADASTELNSELS